MPPNEKEINCYLFDQLTLLERMEKLLDKDDLQGAKEEAKAIRREIERKLYQKPPLTSAES